MDKIVSFLRRYARWAFFSLMPNRVFRSFLNAETRRSIKKAESEGSSDANHRWGVYFMSLMFDSAFAYDQHGKMKDYSAAIVHSEKAINYFTLSFESGNMEGARYSGDLYDLLDDSSKAFKVFLSGAESGDSYCQACLSDMYLTGDGGLQSEHLAYEWNLKAVNCGETVGPSKENKYHMPVYHPFVGSFFQLSQFYVDGRVVKQDIPTAYFWVSIALALLRTYPNLNLMRRWDECRSAMAGPRPNARVSLFTSRNGDPDRDGGTLADLEQEWTLYKADLAARMRPNQISAAERRADDWLRNCDYGKHPLA